MNSQFIVIGVPAPKPIRNAPEGRQRLRLRAKNIGTLFVQSPDGIRKFYLTDHGDHWEPTYEQGRNLRQSAISHQPPIDCALGASEVKEAK